MTRNIERPPQSICSTSDSEGKGLPFIPHCFCTLCMRPRTLDKMLRFKIGNAFLIRNNTGHPSVFAMRGMNVALSDFIASSDSLELSPRSCSRNWHEFAYDIPTRTACLSTEITSRTVAGISTVPVNCAKTAIRIDETRGPHFVSKSDAIFPSTTTVASASSTHPIFSLACPFASSSPTK